MCNENAIANKYIQGDHAGLGNIKVVWRAAVSIVQFQLCFPLHLDEKC